MWVNKMKIGRILYCAAASIPSRRAAFAATVALFAALGAQATTYWLGTGAGASDSNDGTSKDAPFATWEHAFAKAGSANGNVLNILPGTYTLTAAPSAWTSGRQNVTIQGVDADGNPLASATAAAAVVIDGADAYQIAPFNTAINLVVSGITFRNGKGTGGSSATGAAIHVGKSGTSPYNTNQGLVVSNCVFDSCIGGAAVYCLAAGASQFAGCSFLGNANSAASATALYKANSSVDYPLSVRGCTFFGNDGSGSPDTKGVAVHCASSAMFSYCTFDSNTNTSRGVALYLNGAGASNHFERCTFTGNANVKSGVSSTGLDGSGGVCYIGQSQSTNVFANCTFSDNSATGGGGCVMLRLGRFVAENCTFTGNSAAHGSAVAASYETSNLSAAFINCTVSGNTASDGSIVAMSGALAMMECEISGNTYSAYGVSSVTADSSRERCTFKANTTPASETSDSISKAALRLTAGTAANCLVVCNTNVWTGSSSAGVIATGGTVKNCTVVGNSSVGSYPGVTSGSSTIVNSVICGNTGTGKKIQNMPCFSYCVCDGTENDDSAWNNRTGCSIVANLADYGFVDPVNGDYSLKKGSPLRNAGDNSVWAGVAATDIVGKIRINEEIVDIGCYEFFMSNSGMMIFVR